MKKITLLLFLLTVSFGYAQELVTNGDFQTGDATGWIGNAANVVTYDGGVSYFNEANVVTAGASYTVNLSQVLPLTPNATYTFSFDAWTGTGTTRTMIAGIGLNEDPWTASIVTVDLTDQIQNFSYTLVAPGNSTANSRVLFDMGAAVGYVGIDNVSLVEVAATCSDGIQNGDETGVDCGGTDCDPCPPTCTDGIQNGDETGIDCGGSVCDPCEVLPDDALNPTTPDAEVVLSFFNDKPGYTNAYIAEGEFGTRTLVDLGTDTDETIKMDFSIDSWGQYNNTTVDVSTAGFLNFSYYAPDMPAGPDGHEVYIMLQSTGDGDDFYTLKTDGSGDGMLLFDAWQYVSIPLSHFTDQGFDDTDLIVWKLGTPSTAFTKVVYFDNIYFSENTPTLSANQFSLTDFTVYPNPTFNTWTLNSEQTINRIDVYDITGKRVLSQTPANKQVVLDTSNLETGIYIAKVEATKGSSQIKLIKE